METPAAVAAPAGVAVMDGESSKKKRTATAETRKKMSDARRGDKHHDFGRKKPDATKAKIAATLSAVQRFDFDGSTPLPKHMKTVNEVANVGYAVVGHPMIRAAGRVKFTSTVTNAAADTSVMGVLRAKCIFYLEYLNDCERTGREPDDKNDVMKTFVL